MTMKAFMLLLSLALMLILFASPGAADDSSAGTGASPVLTDGTFTVIGFDDGRFIIKLEKDAVLSEVELSSGGERIKATSFSNLDASMQITSEGYLYESGRVACTVNLPDGFKPDKVSITGKNGSEPIEFDISSLQ
jgi:hypothetical protein